MSFYTGVFGWKADRVESSYVLDSVPTPITLRESQGEYRATVRLTLKVDDVGEVAKRAVDMGGKIVTEPHQTHGGKVAHIQDPAGNHITLWKSSLRSKSESIGKVLWRDLTVTDAESVRDFYREVAGWNWQGLDMGDYEDYQMFPEGGSGDPVAGICHARGSNSSLPPQWLIYISVEDIQRSVKAARDRGGELVAGDPEAGYCVLRDPAGAVFALMQV